MYYIYVFDSTTANEAAMAVKEGRCDSIIQYHSNKHQPMTRESKLSRLGQLAQLTSQPPMFMSNTMPQHQQTQPSPQQNLLQPQNQQLTHQQQPQPRPPPAQPQRPLPQSQPSTSLNPLQSMEALSECPNMDSYGHTIHHHPPS